MNILNLNHVSYTYDKSEQPAVNDVSYLFETGKLYCLMGSSGAGKSTLLSLLAGLDLPSAGEIFYKEHNIEKINRDVYHAREIGMIFQGFHLLQNATAAENIKLAMDISCKSERKNPLKAYELLSGVGIDKEKADRKILKLSGGEQQRVAIARAISGGAPVIAADEPTGNLDHENETAVMEIFCRLAHEQDKCVIIVTHSAHVAAFADQVLHLKQGRLSFN